MVEEGRQEVPRGHARVLVMDDEEFILDVTGEVLMSLGYEVETARDGNEAIAQYRRALDEGRRFDAVILDLTIPGGMGGAEAVQRLLEMDPQVKAIVFSGRSGGADEHLGHGFAGAIPKPYRIEDLGRVVGEIIGRG